MTLVGSIKFRLNVLQNCRFQLPSCIDLNPSSQLRFHSRKLRGGAPSHQKSYHLFSASHDVQVPCHPPLRARNYEACKSEIARLKTPSPPPHCLLAKLTVAIQGITEEELAKCQHCQLLSFSKQLEYPIHLKDTKGQQVLPSNFTFIEESILREGVQRAEPEFRSGCNCVDGYQCQRKGCSCLEDMVYDEPGPDNKIYAYHSTPTRYECLRGAILESRDPIYECHSGCACGEYCRNRVVERGRKIPLDLFKTDDGRGWG